MALPFIVFTVLAVVIGSEKHCKSRDFFLPLEGRYCQSSGSVIPDILSHQCISACIQFPTCAAFNYNITEKACVLFTSTCPKAVCNSAMEFDIFTTKMVAENCYEWRPIDSRSWDRAVEQGSGTDYAIRVLKSGSYYIGHWGNVGEKCYAHDGTALLNNIAGGYRCESLWIAEGCTAYLQPLSFGGFSFESCKSAGVFAWLLYARHWSYPWSVRSFKTVSPHFGDYLSFTLLISYI